MYKLDNVEEETEIEEKKEGLVLIFKNNIKYSYILNDPQLYHFFEHVFVMFLSKKFKNLEIINAITPSPSGGEITIMTSERRLKHKEKNELMRKLDSWIMRLIGVMLFATYK